MMEINYRICQNYELLSVYPSSTYRSGICNLVHIFDNICKLQLVWPIVKRLGGL